MKSAETPRVLIDGRLLGTRIGGIARYTAELANALPAAAPDLDVRLLLRPGTQRQVPATSLPPIRTLTPPHHRLERWTLGLEASLRRPDLVHSPDLVQPVVPFAKTVVTIHDLDFLDPDGADALTPDSLRYYRQVCRLARRADAIIAVADYVKRSIVDQTDVPESRVRTIHNGITWLKLPPTSENGARLPAGIQRAIDLRRPIVLMVGTVEPRKRHGLLLDALEISRSRQSTTCPYLIVIGREGWNCGAVVERLRALSTSGDGVWYATAGDELLGQALRHATLLAMPSRKEGFGLPVLEAMVAGVPVVAAARGALPEIAGAAAILIQGDDPEEWSTTIESLIADEPRREALKQAGLRRASDFSWERAATKTAQLYREVLGR